MTEPRSRNACSCWMLPGPDGVSNAVWGLLHATAVDVTTCDGAHYRGAVLGACWAGLPGTRERHLLIESEDGERYALAESRLKVLTPAACEVDSEPAETALHNLGRAIRTAAVPWDAVSVSVPFDEMTGVRATVWFIDHACEPGIDPRVTTRS